MASEWKVYSDSHPVLLCSNGDVSHGFFFSFSKTNTASLFTVAVAKTFQQRSPRNCSGSTNQVGYIIVIARLPGNYGNVNSPCPRAMPSDSGSLLP